MRQLLLAKSHFWRRLKAKIFCQQKSTVSCWRRDKFFSLREGSGVTSKCQAQR